MRILGADSILGAIAVIAPHPVRVAVAMTDGADAEELPRKPKWANKAKEAKARRVEVIATAYRDRLVWLGLSLAERAILGRQWKAKKQPKEPKEKPEDEQVHSIDAAQRAALRTKGELAAPEDQGEKD